MDIELFNGQLTQVFITLNTELDDFEVYGGTTKSQFDIKRTETGEYLVTVPTQVSQMCSVPRYDIFAKRKSTGQEWCILSGKINTKRRCSTGGGLSPVQYRVTIPVVEDSVDVTGKTMVIGIKGDPFTYDDLTEEQKTELVQPAVDAVNEHIADATLHITADERDKWNAATNDAGGVFLMRCVTRRVTSTHGIVYKSAEFPSSLIEPHILLSDYSVNGAFTSIWSEAINGNSLCVITGFLVDLTQWSHPDDASVEGFLAFNDLKSFIERATNGEVTMLLTRLA